MLYRDNVHTCNAGYQAPRSKSLSLVHTNAHFCHWEFKELSKDLSHLSEGQGSLMKAAIQ